MLTRAERSARLPRCRGCYHHTAEVTLDCHVQSSQSVFSPAVEPVSQTLKRRRSTGPPVQHEPSSAGDAVTQRSRNGLRAAGGAGPPLASCGNGAQTACVDPCHSCKGRALRACHKRRGRSHGKTKPHPHHHHHHLLLARVTPTAPEPRCPGARRGASPRSSPSPRAPPTRRHASLAPTPCARPQTPSGSLTSRRRPPAAASADVHTRTGSHGSCATVAHWVVVHLQGKAQALASHHHRQRSPRNALD